MRSGLRPDNYYINKLTLISSYKLRFTNKFVKGKQIIFSVSKIILHSIIITTYIFLKVCFLSFIALMAVIHIIIISITYLLSLKFVNGLMLLN